MCGRVHIPNMGIVETDTLYMYMCICVHTCIATVYM